MIKLEKSVWVYIIVLFILTYIFQIIAILGGGEESILFPIFVGLSMFFPGIGAIIYLIKKKEGLKYINWRIGKPIYILCSLVLPAIITILGILFFEKIGWGTNYEYTLTDNKIDDIDISLVFGSEAQSFPFFILNFVVTGIGFSLIHSLLAIGEEIGWRGFLQKKLLEKNSLLKSLVFLGLVWGFWHFPLIINGFNYPEYPIWGAFLLFPVITVFISFFMGWLTLNSKSVWPAVFAHGGLNSVMTLLFEMDFGEHKFEANFIILGIWSIIGLLSYILISNKYKTNDHVTINIES
ncbi:type II CAAX endopeptidase family protein [uncultured Aquimarina sp.]|uniref:CPBP family intramembrane glutamic endopeptidase n=1 Tax=uncultured Aquimarina sp. TaxID=575652 RepID=UPI00262D5D8D|nr:type II CAAX endopeptidase family protein [uncultured Aquimarina sp.]